LLLLAAALLAAGCGEKPAEKSAAAHDPLAITPNAGLAARVQTGAPAFVDVRETLRVSGRIGTDETCLARFGSPVAGRITHLPVREGDTVRRGQVLATINSTELSEAQLGFPRIQHASGRLQLSLHNAKLSTQANATHAA
jgi:cobalt-zinc-cadmium efflux system membrane fusion protein